jgi:hypothetical protein
VDHRRSRRGFRYDIVGEEREDQHVRVHVLRPWLDSEKQAWAAQAIRARVADVENYAFDDRAWRPTVCVAGRDGPPQGRSCSWTVQSTSTRSTAIREDREGRLSKAPSFWTRRVEVVRYYRRINGIRVPVRHRIGRERAPRRPLDVQDDVRLRRSMASTWAPLPRRRSAARSDFLIH